MYRDGPDDGAVALEDEAEHGGEWPQVLGLGQHWDEVLYEGLWDCEFLLFKILNVQFKTKFLLYKILNVLNETELLL